MSTEPDENEVSTLGEELAGVIRDWQEFARAAYGYDFDRARRDIPADATGLERDTYKDPYLLDFLGLEPLPGDPTIEQIERELQDSEGDK